MPTLWRKWALYWNNDLILSFYNLYLLFKTIIGYEVHSDTMIKQGSMAKIRYTVWTTKVTFLNPKKGVFHFEEPD